MIIYFLIAIVHAALVTYIYTRNDWIMDRFNILNPLFPINLLLSFFWPFAVAIYVTIIPCYFAYKLAVKQRGYK